MGKFSYLMNQTYFRKGFKTEDRELEIGAYYPFIMKNGTKGRHKCIGLVTKNGIYITSMGVVGGRVILYGVGVNLIYSSHQSLMNLSIYNQKGLIFYTKNLNPLIYILRRYK